MIYDCLCVPILYKVFRFTHWLKSTLPIQSRKANIAKTMGTLYTEAIKRSSPSASGIRTQTKLAIVTVDMADLKDKAMTKANARMQSREGFSDPSFAKI